MKNCVLLSTSAVCGAVSAAMLGGVAMAGEANIEVIYTKIPLDASSIVPGAVDLSGNPAVTNFRAFEDLYFSPDGTRWVLKGRTQQGSDLETILLIGSGDTGSMFMQEGQPVPNGVAGELIDFFGSGGGRFNENNDFALSLRARGGTATSFQKVIVYTGGLAPTPTDFNLVARGGNSPGVDLYAGLSDINPPGDETIGNSIGSIHLLNDGTIGAQDSTINLIHTSRRPAIFYSKSGSLFGSVVFDMFKQVGVSTFLDIDGVTVHTYATAAGGLGSNTFYTSPDGAHWIVEGQILGAAADAADVLVYDGQARVREGSIIGTSSVTAHTILYSRILANGDWIARGARRVGAAASGVWAARNGVVFAQTGDGISTLQGGEAWGPSFQAVNGNVKGDWVITGKSDTTDLAADDVLVFNGAVMVREGDPVDLNGNGKFDDNVFIGRGNNTLVAFDADDLFITEDGDIYFIANLRDGQGNDLNSNPVFGTPHAFMRISTAGPLPCLADITGDLVVNVNDLLEVINNWGACDKPCPPNCDADVTADCTVNVNDLLEVINGWGPCFPTK